MLDTSFFKRFPLRSLSFGLLISFLLIGGMLSGCQWMEQADKRTSDHHPRGANNPDGTALNADENHNEPVFGGDLSLYTLEPDVWDPLLMRRHTLTLNPYEGLVYRGLFRYDETGQWTHDLAQHVSMDHRDDGTVVVSFNLPTDVRWPDGTAVTWADVRETFQYYLHPFYYGAWKDHLSNIAGTSSYRGGSEKMLSGITVDETGRIHITLDQPTALTFRALTAPLLKADEIAGREPDDVYALAANGQLSGLGPYRISDKPTSQTISFVRRPQEESGMEQAAFLEHITVTTLDPQAFIHQAQVSVVETLAAKLSKAPSPASLVLPPGISSDVIDALARDLDASPTQGKRDAPSPYHFEHQALPYTYYLAFNMRTVDQPHRALIAKQLLASNAFDDGSMARPIGIIRPDFLGTFMDQPFNDAYKKGLLSLSETAPSSLPEGTLSLYYDEDDPISTYLATHLAVLLERDHLRIDMHGQPHDAYYATIFSGRPYDMFIWPLARGQMLGEWWRYLGRQHDVDRLGLNVMHYDRPEVDLALSAAYHTSPDRVDQDALKKAFQSIGEDGVLMPLFRPEAYRIQSARVHAGHALFEEKIKVSSEKDDSASQETVTDQAFISVDERRALWFWWITP